MVKTVMCTMPSSFMSSMPIAPAYCCCRCR